MRLSACLAVLATLFASAVQADEKLAGIACRSVHLAYGAPEGIAFYTELTVEQSAEGTYFMAAGWSKGYFGIQELADRKKLVLFSVWDPTAGDDPKNVDHTQRVKLLHKDDAVRFQRFGGEGTGGQSFFDYEWKVGETYRFLVAAKADGGTRTAYAGYFFLPATKEWKHLVTFSTITNGTLLKGCYSFVEDFRRNRVSATQERRATFGNGWVKPASGNWVPLDKARFTADANPVLNIDAGAHGDRYFLATGGNVRNDTTKLGQTIRREPDKSAAMPPSDLPQFE